MISRPQGLPRVGHCTRALPMMHVTEREKESNQPLGPGVKEASGKMQFPIVQSNARFLAFFRPTKFQETNFCNQHLHPTNIN